MDLEKFLKEEEEARAEFEAKTEYKGYTVAELRKVSDKIFNSENWKNSWAASVPHNLVNIIIVSVEFFHADEVQIHGIEPITGNVLLSGNGYQAY